MATRAPKGVARPNGGSAGRNRAAGGAARSGSGAGGSRGGGTGRASTGRTGRGRTGTGRGGTRTGAGRGGAAGRRGGTPYYRSRGKPTPPRRGPAEGMRASANPFVIMIGWVAAAVDRKSTRLNSSHSQI